MARMKTLRTMIAVVVILSLLSVASARPRRRGRQNTDDYGRPIAPMVEVEDAPVPWVAFLCTVVALAGVAVVAFKSSRRTHLD